MNEHSTKAPFRWTCPFCNHPVTITAPDLKTDITVITLSTHDGPKQFELVAIACPNPECRRLVVKASLYKISLNQYQPGLLIKGDLEKQWSLIPSGTARPFPDYIPTPLREDYRLTS